MIAAHGLERFVSDVIIEGSLEDTTSLTSSRMTGRIFIKLIRHPPLHQKAATFAGEATYNKAVARHRLRRSCR